MAVSTKTTVRGLKETRALLRKLPDRAQKKVMGGAVRSGATVFKKEVKKNAPVGDEPSPISKKFGPLKDNIRVVRLKRGIPKTSSSYRVDTGKSPQGFWREFGTSRQPAQPWFRPAVDGGWQSAVNKIKERLGAGVAREAAKLGRSLFSKVKK